jgi:PKD repeat protein/sugar lactone lactonase YvrE
MEQSDGQMGAFNAQATSFSLGQPGLSFRYVQTFGVTEEPFLPSNNHFYFVEGIGTVTNTVWIGDHLGRRAVRFNNAGAYMQTIGKAGVTDYTGTPLVRVSDIAADGSGNVWIVDSEAAHVIKYNASGQKVAELGQAWDRGSSNDRFNDPIGIAIDGSGNIYVSDSGYWWHDYGNHRIQIFNSSGTYLATIGGTACGTGNTQLCWPRRIAIYGSTLYVADGANHRVQIFNISNPVSPTYQATLGQTGVPGSGNNRFHRPQGVAVDMNYIYVADTLNHRVQIFNRDTRAYVATIGGSFGTGNYRFKYPTDVAVDAAGNIYVADFHNKRVQQYNSSRVYQRTYGTTGVSYLAANDRFYHPEGVAVGPDGSIYIAEGHGMRLVKLDAAGVPQWAVGEAGQPGGDQTRFSFLTDVAVSPQGYIFTTEAWGSVPWIGGNHRVKIYRPDGAFVGSFGGYGSGNYQFIAPYGITIDHTGKVYIADRDNHRVQIYSDQLAYLATLGQTGVPGSDNAHFNAPYDVAVDRDGNIYVADEGNDRIQVFNSNRNYVRTIGITGVTGYEFDRFSSWGPHHLAVDSHGRLYVADPGNTIVHVFDNFANNNAYLTSIGGSNGTRSSQFRHVLGIAVGPDDSVYTAEVDNNHRIQKFAPGVPGWKQVNINGFGQRRNSWISSLGVFGGYIYAGSYNSSNGAQLWRASNGLNWTPVVTTGFGYASNVGISYLVEFNGQLYAGIRNQTNNPPYTQGGEIWRSSDGLNWTRVVSQGFGDPTNAEVMRLAVFNNQIYAGTWSYTYTHGAEIWRSSTGNSNDWQQVVSNGFGDASNAAIMDMVEFNGALYAGTRFGALGNGADLWRSTDGLNWTPVVTDGFGYTGTYDIAALAVFQNYLYAGTGKYDFVSQTYPGGQVWRCSQASNCDELADWELVVPNGFGNPDNINISALRVFDGYLYAIPYNFSTGLEVWRTSNGTNWEQVSLPGLGDSNNRGTYWNNGIATFNNRLYIGTTNWASGGRVWKKTVTADFAADPLIGPPGTVVTFTNLAGGDVLTATWDFGDGSPALTVNHTGTVTHIYAAPGTYTVTLTVQDDVDTDARTRTGYIRIAYRAFMPLVMRAYNPLIALYDDFNNAAFNGFYHPLKWRFWGDETYFSARQQGGVLVITNTASTPANVGLDLPLAMPMERTLRQMQRFQARLRLSSGSQGTGAKIQIMRDVNGSGWWTQCSLNAYGSAPDFGCDIVNYTPGNYVGEYAVSWPSALAFDTWYTARIDINPNTAQVCFYLNNNLLGCHTPSNANALKTYNDFVPRIGSWNGQAGATGIRYFDDVHITPAQ